MPAILQLHLAVLLFGAAGLMGKLVDLPAMQLVLGRTLIGALALALFVGLFSKSQRQGWWPANLRPQLRLSLLISGVVLAVHWWSFFLAIQLAGVGVALVGFSAFPVFVTLLEALTEGRRVALFDSVTTALVVFGLWLVAPTIDWQDMAFQGLVWGVISGALFAVLALQNKALVQVFGGVRLGLWQQGLAAIFCFLVVDITSVQLDSDEVVYVLILGALLTALPHVLFITCLKQVRAHTAAIVASLEPVYGIAFAWLLLAEQPALATLLGALIILSSVALSQWQHSLKRLS